MPSAESPFVIGVIREKEKTLLESDEYTRLVEAATAEAGRRSLVDTVYGTFLEREGSAVAALSAHLAEEWSWLTDVVDDQQVLQFLGARYDGLNIANMLLDKVARRETLRVFSPLGNLSVEMLSDLLHGKTIDGREIVPEHWREFLQEELGHTESPDWSAGEMLTRIKEQVQVVWEATAKSNLMKDLTHVWSEHLQYDEAWRQEAGDVQELELTVPAFVDEAAAEALREEDSAVAYELAWDARVVELLRPAKIVPVGSDPIVAYWLTKEMEVKTLRLLLAGKGSGLKPDVLRELIRPLYWANS